MNFPPWNQHFDHFAYAKWWLEWMTFPFWAFRPIFHSRTVVLGPERVCLLAWCPHPYRHARKNCMIGNQLKAHGKNEDILHINRLLVGGFNPFEKYYSKWESSPSRDENKKYLKPPPRLSISFINSTPHVHPPFPKQTPRFEHQKFSTEIPPPQPACRIAPLHQQDRSRANQSLPVFDPWVPLDLLCQGWNLGNVEGLRNGFMYTYIYIYK